MQENSLYFRMPGYCKHAFALLFGLEYYADDDASNPSCTSLAQEWGKPSSSIDAAPTAASDLEYRKTILDHPPKTSLNPASKRSYTASSDNSSVINVTGVLEKVGQVNPEAAAVQVDTALTVERLKSLCEVVDEWKNRSNLTLEEKCIGCADAIKVYFAHDRAKKVEQLTSKQSSNPIWFTHRILRITASQAADILGAIRRFETGFDELPKK